MPEHLTSADLIEVEVGYDRFRARAVADTCTHRGLKVELLEMDAAGQAPGLVALQQHRLLARAADAEAIAGVLDELAVG